jgi:hypothetical protein
MIKFRNVLALVATLAAINASFAADQSIVLASRDSSRKCCDKRLRTPSLNTGHLPVIGP